MRLYSKQSLEDIDWSDIEADLASSTGLALEETLRRINPKSVEDKYDLRCKFSDLPCFINTDMVLVLRFKHKITEKEYVHGWTIPGRLGLLNGLQRALSKISVDLENFDYTTADKVTKQLKDKGLYNEC